MGWLQAIVLSAVQGITEFIPVSSSGHLVLMQHFLGVEIVEDNIFFEILVHFGTSLAILLVYYRDLAELARSCLSGERQRRLVAWRYVGCLAVGSLPVALAGLFFYDQLAAIFARPSLAALMLLITGAILYSSKFRPGTQLEVSIKFALLIGLAQAMALLPGISRSGITIVAALMIGVSRTEAGRFSFLLALPALFGASFLDFRKIDSLETLPMSLSMTLAALAVSAVVGYFSLKILLDFVHRGQLHYFSYYCVAAALVSLVLILGFNV